MHRRDIEMLQEHLNTLGYDVGAADGLAGSRTRAALKAFQLDRGLPADGHPSQEVLDALTEAVRERAALTAVGGSENAMGQ